MKVGDAIQGIALFFNDFIGSFVPGLVLAFGLSAMHLGPEKCAAIAKSLDGGFLVLVAVGMLFAVGHALLAFYEHAIRKVLLLCRAIKEFDKGKAAKRESYKSFMELVQGREGERARQELAPSTWDYNDLRSVAMTVSTEGASLGRRFTFISLLCNGVGTVAVIVVLDFIACLAFAPALLHSYASAAPWWAQVALLLTISWALFKRGESFHERAMTTPFAAAVTDVKLTSRSNAR